MALIFEMGRRPYYWPPLHSPGPTDITLKGLLEVKDYMNAIMRDVPTMIITTEEIFRKIRAEIPEDMTPHNTVLGNSFAGIQVKAYRTAMLCHAARLLAEDQGETVFLILDEEDIPKPVANNT